MTEMPKKTRQRILAAPTTWAGTAKLIVFGLWWVCSSHKEGHVVGVTALVILSVLAALCTSLWGYKAGIAILTLPYFIVNIVTWLMVRASTARDAVEG